MLTKRIESVQHPFVKRCVSLREKREERQAAGEALIVGRKLVAEQPRLLALIGTAPHPPFPCEAYWQVSAPILKKISGIAQPEEGVAAIVPIPSPADLSQANYCLILDQIADPGNLGTLFRTARALGWEGIWVVEGSADPYNDKALRAAQGATFAVPFCQGSGREVVEWLERRRAACYLADTSGEVLPSLSFSPPLALILSNEARGPSTWAVERGRRVTIPMPGGGESLNVAQSGAILLYAMRQR